MTAQSAEVQHHMEIIGSDGQHVGVVDHMDIGDQIKLTKKDPSSGGKHHFIPLDWVDHVDQKVHLTKSSKDVTDHWRSAA